MSYAPPTPAAPVGQPPPRRPGDHSDNDPAQIGQLLKAHDVLGKLRPVGAMLISVVLDGNLGVLPPHVEVVLDPATDGDRYLSTWRRESTS